MSLSKIETQKMEEVINHLKKDGEYLAGYDSEPEAHKEEGTNAAVANTDESSGIGEKYMDKPKAKPRKSKRKPKYWREKMTHNQVSSKSIGILELCPESNPELSDLVLFKDPLANVTSDRVERWRREHRVEMKKERERERERDIEKGEVECDVEVIERILYPDLKRRAARFKSKHPVQQFEDSLMTEFRKELEILLKSDSASGSSSRMKKSTMFPATRLNSTDLMKQSNLCLWNLYRKFSAPSSGSTTEQTGRPALSSSRFLRLLSACRLTSRATKFTRADADLLFMRLSKTTAKHSTSWQERSAK